jgi:hypothetical protein
MSNVAVAEPPAQPIKVTVPVPETVRQGYLEIREVTTKEVVTVIELLSPVNKRPGKGRQSYESKRERILGSFTHLVEIDLLRAWQPMPIFVNGIQSHYRILVSRGDCRPTADLYGFNLRQAIPSFPLPLRSRSVSEGESSDSEPIIDLQVLLNGIYDRAAYDLKLDYTTEPVPPLLETEAAWADGLLKEQGLR